MTRNVVTRSLVVLFGAIVTLAGVLPVPAQAATTAFIERDGEPTSIAVSGRTLVDTDDVVDDVWIVNGRATVRGRVNGSIVVLNGGVAVSGSVDGDIIVVRGGVWVGPEGAVDGDIQASRDITLADGAALGGTSSRGSVVDGLRALTNHIHLRAWVGLTVALLALGLITTRLTPGAVDRARVALTSRPFGSGLRGAVLLGSLPVFAALAFAVFAGGLLGVLLLTATALIAVAGLAVTAATIGRGVLSTDHAVRGFLTGALVLRVVALVPLLGGALTVIAAVMGTGALLRALKDRKATAPAIDATADSAAATSTTTVAPRPAVVGAPNDLDLRFGGVADPDERFAREPAGATGWLDTVLTDATGAHRPRIDVRDHEPLIDLTTGPPPTAAGVARPGIHLFDAPPARDESAPQVIASLPVREDNFADDPGAAPGNGRRQSLFVDGPGPAHHNGVPLFRGPADGSDSAAVGDDMRLPTRGHGGAPSTLLDGPEAGPVGVRDRLFVDGPTGPADDTTLGGIFADGSRVWRPSPN